MDVDGGFNGGFKGGFFTGFRGWFHLAVLGYWPQQSIQQLRQKAFTAISQEGLTGLLLNELVILQTHFTGFVKQTLFYWLSNGYYNSDQTL